ncbi:hypothetical protein [Anaerosporobacter sp.]|uniref:hypothetical protein n=1 Tax=Anaerosporobacter sp. TaxID=1872529 RepID=UPI00286F864B|nr:hypothetical protein [Anaerosporobacter sp.]
MPFNKLGSQFTITSKKSFSPNNPLRESTVRDAAKFAFDMTYGKSGEHRSTRSGGTHSRRNSEIFADTFQGKLSEFAAYNLICNYFPNIGVPDLETYSLGKWDSCDFFDGVNRISIKSTKSFGNLLLLETKDWSKDALYIPNIETGNANYDFFVLVRINPFCSEILRGSSLINQEMPTLNQFEEIILKHTWNYDSPGFITHSDLKQIINNGFVIPQGAYLNGRMRMDAENYYVQAGDFRGFADFENYVRN